MYIHLAFTGAPLTQQPCHFAFRKTRPGCDISFLGELKILVTIRWLDVSSCDRLSEHAIPLGGYV